MGFFLTRLHLDFDPDDDVKEATLLQDLVFDSAVLGKRLIVPAGEKTDLASVPRIPFAYMLTGGKAKYASVPHDYLCRTGIVSRHVADAVFLEAMEATNVPGWRRHLMHAAVRGYAVVAGKDYTEQPESPNDIYFG